MTSKPPRRIEARSLACVGYIAGPSADGTVEVAPCNFGAVAYVCPNCDLTHLHLRVPESPYEVRVDLSPEQAEFLGQQLVNPPTLHSLTKGPSDASDH